MNAEQEESRIIAFAPPGAVKEVSLTQNHGRRDDTWNLEISVGFAEVPGYDFINGVEHVEVASSSTTLREPGKSEITVSEGETVLVIRRPNGNLLVTSRGPNTVEGVREEMEDVGQDPERLRVLEEKHEPVAP